MMAKKSETPRSRLPEDVQRLSLRLADEFARAADGAELFLVGGIVRDVLLGAAIGRDLDFATNVSPRESERALRAAGGKVFKIGEKFGTIGGVFSADAVRSTGSGTRRGARAAKPGGSHGPGPHGLADDVGFIEEGEHDDAHQAEPGEQAAPGGHGERGEPGEHGAPGGKLLVEVTTYRAEAYQAGSRKPEVAFRRHLADDLARRDFTINAIALDPKTGAIEDPFGGREDLARGVIRAVGNPVERFQEDPLRLLRAVRFASRLGFEIDPTTADAICESAPALGQISRERVCDELEKILMGPAPAQGIRLLCDLRLADYSLPDVPKLRGMAQETGRHKDVFTHTLQVLDRTPPRLALRWAALLHDIAKPTTKRIENGKVTFHGHDRKGERMARRILGELHQPGELIDRVARLVGLHLRANAYEGAWTDSAVRRFVLEAGDDLIEDLLALSRADVTTGRVERRMAIARSVAELEERIRELRAQEDIAKLASPLDGLELMQMFERGPGPWIQPIKDHLKNLVIEGELAAGDKEAAAAIARRLYAEAQGHQ